MRADNASAQAAFAKASDYLERQPLVANHRPLSWITDHVCRIVEQPAPIWWWVSTIIFGAVAALTPAMLTYLVATGVGVWGLNVPVCWAWDITNFVFWIGIGHAG
ncbi:hydrogenase, partial [bacterium]|nr:hydrogenase [bacterium]